LVGTRRHRGQDRLISITGTSNRPASGRISRIRHQATTDDDDDDGGRTGPDGFPRLRVRLFGLEADMQRRFCGVRVRISDPRFIDDLEEFLAVQLDAVHERVAINEIEVSPLGSLSESGAAMALDLQLRAWEATHPGVSAERRYRA
jgi:hypothetical protein